MAQVRFNHMELTVPVGTLDDTMRGDLAVFMGGVLGLGDQGRRGPGRSLSSECVPDEGQFILVAEHDRPMQAPGYDHLGLLCDTRDEVDEILAECRRWADKDDRLRLKVYDDLVTGNVVVHAFYVKYLLPIWFDVQSIYDAPGNVLERRWAVRTLRVASPRWRDGGARTSSSRGASVAVVDGHLRGHVRGHPGHRQGDRCGEGAVLRQHQQYVPAPSQNKKHKGCWTQNYGTCLLRGQFWLPFQDESFVLLRGYIVADVAVLIEACDIGHNDT